MARYKQGIVSLDCASSGRCFIMESSSDSEEPFVCSLRPKRLFPSEVSAILFGKPNRRDELSRDMDSEDSEIDDVYLQHEKEMGDKETSSSVSMVPDDIPGEVDVSTSRPTRDQHFTAEQACCFLQESNYETSGDEISEVTEISTSSSSDSAFDLSDPDAGMGYEGSDCVYSADTEMDMKELSGEELLHDCVSSTTTDRMTERNAVRKAYLHGTPDSSSSSSSEEDGKSASKRRKALSKKKASASKSRKASASRSRKASTKSTEPDHELSPHEISDTDYEYCLNDIIPFSPRRNVGIHLPSGMVDKSPMSLFRLFFSNAIVDDICRCSDEYAELRKSKWPGMYKLYKGMTREDFLKLLGMLIHFGYRKIPQYRLAWKRTSLCYDPFISSTMSRNKFESLMSFLHLVDKATEEKLKSERDKLAKVNYCKYVFIPLFHV